MFLHFISTSAMRKSLPHYASAGFVVTMALSVASCDRSPENDDHGKVEIPTHAKEVHWGYDGETGPEKWAQLDPAWSLAGAGKQQSPIDISSEVDDPDAPVLEPSYKDTALNIGNNGHTLTQAYDAGSSISVAGSAYDLAQFHFHHKSEHTIDGEHFDMECHLVHKNSDGNLLVVGVLIKPGAENPLLAKLWSHLPAEAGQTSADPAIKFSIAELLPEDLSYYHYQGSLTTPPCSEGVRWYVLQTPVEASAEQIAAFTKLYPHNYRPVQPLFDRKITSN